MTPLHYAARYGKIDTAKATEATKSEKTWKAIAFLMKHSNDKNAKDKYGFTVLHHAVYRGNTLAVQRLIEGKEVRGRTPKCKYSAETCRRVHARIPDNIFAAPTARQERQILKDEASMFSQEVVQDLYGNAR